ncbi:MAG: hypothetical protein AB8G05_17035 [Oligoflexales bacterium]
MNVHFVSEFSKLIFVSSLALMFSCSSDVEPRKVKRDTTEH